MDCGNKGSGRGAQLRCRDPFQLLRILLWIPDPARILHRTHHKTMTAPALKHPLPCPLISKEKTDGKSLLRCGGMGRTEHDAGDRTAKSPTRAACSTPTFTVGDGHGAFVSQTTFRACIGICRALPPLRCKSCEMQVMLSREGLGQTVGF